MALPLLSMRAELQRQISDIDYKLARPQHYSYLQLRAWRKQRAKLNKKLQQCPLPEKPTQLNLQLR